MKIIKRSAVKRRESGTPTFDISTCTDELLIFDTETTSDFSQRLRVGACMFKNRRTHTFRGFALFVADDLPANDRETVDDYARGFGARVPHLIADQCAIRERELREQNSRLPIETRKDDDAMAALVAQSATDIRRAFRGLALWSAQARALPVMSRSHFAMVLTDAMRGRLAWGPNTPESPCAVVALNAIFDFGAIAAPNPAPSARTGNVPVIAWGYDSPSTGEKGFGFHLCDCPKRQMHDPEMVTLGGRKGVRQRAECPDHPSILSRHLGGRKNQFGLAGGHHGGPVIDLSVLGRAILGPGDASLRGLGERMGATILKRKEETGHGTALTVEYLDYLMVDVLATAELCELQLSRYAEHGLSAPVTSIFSEASIGKAYLSDFGIPGEFASRDFIASDRTEYIRSGDLFRIAQRAYQGARSEVMERLTVKTVIHCDFKSQYPSVNALMGLQSLLTGSEYRVRRGSEAVDKARQIIDMADLDWLQKADNWKALRILIRLQVSGCLLPSKYDDPKTTGRTIYGMTEFSEASEADEWYPISDAISSKLLCGRTPVILDAIEVVTGRQVSTLAKDVFGTRLELGRDDLFLEIIEQRTTVKSEQKKSPKGSERYEQLDNVQNNLKLIANSTSYGVLAETTMIGTDETAGRYYAPFIAAHITGGSRLLLSMAQALAARIGRAVFGTPIDHAMCDTDSMAFIMPDGVDYALFCNAIADVCRYFSELSPYRTDKNLFARELPTDGDMRNGVRTYFFGVSCKRYCMFNLVDGDAIKLRKVSSHGLGHIRFDNGNVSDDRKGDQDTVEYDDGDLRALPSPDRLDKWAPDQGRMWTRAIERALGLRNPGKGEANPAGFPVEAWNSGVMRKPVGITTPGLLLEFAGLGVRPGSFFLTMPERKGSKLRICMPRSASTREIMAGTFRDKSGSPLPVSQVSRCATPIHEGLRGYFVNPERKATGTEARDGTQAAGRLSYHVRTASSAVTRNRRGKDGSQGDLLEAAE